MQVYEVPIDITSEGNLELPEVLLERIRRGQSVRVIALLDEPEGDEDDIAWAGLSTEQFFAGYSEADAIYDAIE